MTTTPKPKPFTITNAWAQLNSPKPDRWLKHEDGELPDGVHPSRKVNLAQLRRTWGAPKTEKIPELKQAKVDAKAAYEAGDRIAARKAWGTILTGVYPILKTPVQAGVSLR